MLGSFFPLRATLKGKKPRLGVETHEPARCCQVLSIAFRSLERTAATPRSDRQERINIMRGLSFLTRVEKENLNMPEVDQHGS